MILDHFLPFPCTSKTPLANKLRCVVTNKQALEPLDTVMTDTK